MYHLVSILCGTSTLLEEESVNLKKISDKDLIFVTDFLKESFIDKPYGLPYPHELTLNSKKIDDLVNLICNKLEDITPSLIRDNLDRFCEQDLQILIQKGDILNRVDNINYFEDILTELKNRGIISTEDIDYYSYYMMIYSDSDEENNIEDYYFNYIEQAADVLNQESPLITEIIDITDGIISKVLSFMNTNASRVLFNFVNTNDEITSVVFFKAIDLSIYVDTLILCEKEQIVSSMPINGLKRLIHDTILDDSISNYPFSYVIISPINDDSPHIENSIREIRGFEIYINPSNYKFQETQRSAMEIRKNFVVNGELCDPSDKEILVGREEGDIIMGWDC